MVADNAYRSTARSAGLMCRVTPEERDEIKLRAKAAGCSVQTYIIRKVLDRPNAQDLPRGPHRRHDEPPGPPGPPSDMAAEHPVMARW
jgi:hypothetical protein